MATTHTAPAARLDADRALRTPDAFHAAEARAAHAVLPASAAAVAASATVPDPAEPATGTGADRTRPRRGRRLNAVVHVLSWACVAFAFYLGYSFLVTPESAVPGFGLPAWPHGEAVAFLNVKGVRDLGVGVILLGLLATRQMRAFGWALLGTAVIPLGDMTVILARGGSTAIAFSVHFATAAFIGALGAVIAWRERPRKTGAANGR